jgi:hypothetical protein
MPRFYFDVREGVRFAPDEDGLEFPDVETAEREAATTAAETATVTLALDRVDPEPTARGLKAVKN